MLKIFYYLLLSLALVYINQSVFFILVPPENINILLIFLVFIAFVWGFNLAFYFAVFIGFFASFYSYLPFGIYMLIYLLIIFIVDYLHRQIFINFTFFTNLILIVLSIVLYNLLLVGANFIFYLVSLTRIYITLDVLFFENLLRQLFFNIVLSSVVFIFAKAIFKKLNLTILAKR